MSSKPFLDVLAGKTVAVPPVWMMRQAGRYLPEYMQVRGETGSFLNLCYNPARAAEVTLQPISRFGFDAAIIFSDILVIPHALGQNLAFKEGEGPVLDPINDGAGIAALKEDGFLDRLNPVFEALDLVSSRLNDETALIGFCGAPWTVATYMVGGRGSPDQKAARMMAYSKPDDFARLMDLLVNASISYLAAQVKAGAEVLQVFDSWAGNLPEPEFDKWCIGPMKRIRDGLKILYPDIPVIGFPRACGEKYLPYVEQTGVSAVSLDSSISTGWAAKHLQPLLPVQGNLDPLLVVAGGAAMEAEVRRITEDLSGGGHIFNLGHGLVPETPPEHVAEVIRILRDS